MTDLSGFISLVEACEHLNATYGFAKRNENIYKFVEDGLVSQIKKFKVGRFYKQFISKNEFIALCDHLEDLRTNYYTLKEIGLFEEFKELTTSTLVQQCKQLFETSKLHPIKKCWVVSKKEIEDFRCQFYYKDKLLYHKTFLDFRQLENELGFGPSHISRLINNGAFPSYIKKQNRYFVPIEDVAAFKQQRIEEAQREEELPYDKEQAIKDIISYVDNASNEAFRETGSLYKEFCRIDIRKMNAEPVTIRAKARHFIKVFEKLVDNLNKDIFLLDFEELDKLASEVMSEVGYMFVIFSRFSKYCDEKKKIKRTKQLTHRRITNSNKDKEIYTAKEFFEFYLYIQDVKKHISKALENQHYSNMWAYCIVLVTDAWRGSDIIKQMPPLELGELGIDSLDWFKMNMLSSIQSQEIINQLYLQLKGKRAGKNNALLNFLVEPNLGVPLANALVISELHRRKNNDSYLLQTFTTKGKLKKNSTNGTIKHKIFFEDFDAFNDFSSRKFNRSVITYFYYSLSDEVEGDADVALELNRHIRSHKKTSTTEVYVQTTNRDGTIGTVSTTLFRRGLFGWVYNYLIMLAFQNGEVKPTLEERTKQVEALRTEYPSPAQIENFGLFFYQKDSFVPLREYQGDMNQVFANIANKRSTLASQLRKLSREEIRSILKRLAKGEMPSKNENAQCLVYPDCKKPGLHNCYGCEYVVPKHRLLIELKTEFERIIESVKSVDNENIIRKQSKFLADIMVIVSEAVDAYGESSETYLSLRDIERGCRAIADKIDLRYFQDGIEE